MLIRTMSHKKPKGIQDSPKRSKTTQSKGPATLQPSIHATSNKVQK